MDNLRKELRKCLQKRRNSLDIVEGGWISFISLLVKVLENQPINNPSEDISLFSFIPAADRCVRGIAWFKKPIGKHDHYDFGNAY